MDKIINLCSYYNNPTLSGDFDSARLRKDLESFLSSNEQDKLVIDLSRLELLSPSFAYEVFGKLVDTYGLNIKNRIVFLNDPLNLSKRILDAFSRRASVKAAESKAI